MIGFLNINKPKGLTSHDVVARVRQIVSRTTGRKVKVGHAGTLDPAATGVLPVAVGQATRLIEYLTNTSKGYRTVVQLGITTDTDDAEGTVIAERPVPVLDQGTVEKTITTFCGTIMQVPPMYSAVHHHGKRLYELARANQTVERPPRQVTVEQIDDQTAYPLTDQLVLDIVCSKGTYIRSLARDIGEALGCGAHVAMLERTHVGPFSLENAVSLAALQEEDGLLEQVLLPPETGVAHLPSVSLDEEQAKRVGHGLPVDLPVDLPVNLPVNLPPDLPSIEPVTERVRAHTSTGVLVALLCRRGDQWHPEKVLPHIARTE
jgi:tRNA pseudouridine55 synthase